MLRIEFLGETLLLWPHKAMYWPKEKALLLADLHLGKVNHFRKSGIPVPTKANDKNMEALITLLQETKPDRVICMGDLFHSHYNPEWEVLGEVVKHFGHITFELVVGNHDILSAYQYERNKLIRCDTLYLSPFCITHHPPEKPDADYYHLSGHVHPGVVLRGKGKQAITLPCFYFGEQQGLLPAFGTFTGLARIKPKKNDRIFVIVENNVIDVTAHAHLQS